MSALDDTHDPSLRSSVEAANEPGCDFPIQNLPLGAFRRAGSTPRPGIAIGDRVLDLEGASAAGLIEGRAAEAVAACGGGRLNGLMALGRGHRVALRRRASELLREGAPPLPGDLVVPLADVELVLPADVGDYTDFYASIHHATNVGRLFRPDQPLLPNYKHVPIAYHGRASSLVPSGTPVRRPAGQTRPEGADRPVFGPSNVLDYEVEVGIWIGPGNRLGEPIAIGEAEEHVVGLCLVNDWSARDLQRWEYQPLGPFLSKSFATTVSPWIVTLEALEPFRVPAAPRPPGDPPPLPYLDSPDAAARGGIDVTLEAALGTAEMRRRGLPPGRLARASLRDLYWTVAQMVTHHASNGCNLRSGDLLASGTVSGAGAGALGCMLEINGAGRAIELPTGERRRFLEDGDEVVLRAWCERQDARRIGFGECRGVVLPARG